MIIIKKCKVQEIDSKNFILLVNPLGKLNSSNKEFLSKYPEAEREYLVYCNRNDFREDVLKGFTYTFVFENEILYLIYCQKNDLKIDYKILEELLRKIERNSLDTEYRMLFKNGFEKEDGEWNLVLDIINKVFKNKKVILYSLEE